MVNLLESRVSTRRYPNLLLHCGAKAIARRDVLRVITPFPTDTWNPIPHMDLIQHVEQTLKSNRLTIGTQAHSLSHDGMRYFGLMEIKGRATDLDYCWVLGLRNSHDKTFPAGIVAGSSVFCCDNLAFSGEVKIARKHTRFINRDMPFLVQQAIGRLIDKWHDQDIRIDAYRNTKLKDRDAHDLNSGNSSSRLSPPSETGPSSMPSLPSPWKIPASRGTPPPSRDSSSTQSANSMHKPWPPVPFCPAPRCSPATLPPPAEPGRALASNRLPACSGKAAKK